MDNLCHTLAGAALGEAGFKRTTRFGNAVLMVAANLPDIDVLAFATGTPLVAFRRGWTHGVLAQALLPVLLAGAVALIARWRPARAGPSQARFGALLALSYIGVISHVLLDALNTYGIRLLMPFSNRWFYGDAVFIVDPWLWVAFGAGVSLARRAGRPVLARAAVGLALVYIAVMVSLALSSRQAVLNAWIRERGTAPERLMVGPVAIDPFRKAIIADAGDAYVTGTYEWWPDRLAIDPTPIPKRDDEPAVRQAREAAMFRAILTWARFPYYELSAVEAGTRVTIRDARFAARVGTASVLVPATR